jgi:integrase
MATLKQNSTYINGKRVFGNYRLQINLPTGRINISLPNTKQDKQTALDMQTIANSVEVEAKRNPSNPPTIVHRNKQHNDWTPYLYSKLDLLDKLIKPEKKKVEKAYTFEMAYSEMIQYKSNSKSLRPRAVEVIKNNRRIFQELMGHNIEVKKFDFAMFSKLLNRLATKKLRNGKIGYSDTTKNIQLRQLRSLLNYCVKAGHINRVCFTTDDIPQPDTSCQDKTYISQEAFGTICALAPNPIYASYWKVAYATGLRLRELANAPDTPGYQGLWHSIQKKDGHWIITVEVGKNKKKKKAITVLPDEYYKDYQIMVNHYKYYSPDCISKNFTKASRLAGFDKFTFRNTRNSFGGNLLKNGYSTFVVSKLMRHSSIAMTDKYLKDMDYQWNMIKKELN